MVVEAGFLSPGKAELGEDPVNPVAGRQILVTGTGSSPGAGEAERCTRRVLRDKAGPNDF